MAEQHPLLWSKPWEQVQLKPRCHREGLIYVQMVCYLHKCVWLYLCRITKANYKSCVTVEVVLEVFCAVIQTIFFRRQSGCDNMVLWRQGSHGYSSAVCSHVLFLSPSVYALMNIACPVEDMCQALHAVCKECPHSGKQGKKKKEWKHAHHRIFIWCGACRQQPAKSHQGAWWGQRRDKGKILPLKPVRIGRTNYHYLQIDRGDIRGQSKLLYCQSVKMICITCRKGYG